MVWCLLSTKKVLSQSHVHSENPWQHFAAKTWKKKKKPVPPNPAYKEASGGREAVKIVRATKLEVRWERKAGEQLKIRAMNKGGRRLEPFQNGRNTSPSLAMKKGITVKHSILWMWKASLSLGSYIFQGVVKPSATISTIFLQFSCPLILSVSQNNTVNMHY